MKKILKKVLNYGLIVLFFSLGFIGLALPIVPQTIFFMIALILVSFEVPFLEKFITDKLKSLPEVLKVYTSLRLVLEKYLK